MCRKRGGGRVKVDVEGGAAEGGKVGEKAGAEGRLDGARCQRTHKDGGECGRVEIGRGGKLLTFPEPAGPMTRTPYLLIIAYESMGRVGAMWLELKYSQLRGVLHGP